MCRPAIDVRVEVVLTGRNVARAFTVLSVVPDLLYKGHDPAVSVAFRYKLASMVCTSAHTYPPIVTCRGENTIVASAAVRVRYQDLATP